jgi:hypothetical protein
MLDSPPPAGPVTDFTGLSNAFREQVAMAARYIVVGKSEERTMPVLLLWGIPAVIFVGGVGYFLVHATH